MVNTEELSSLGYMLRSKNQFYELFAATNSSFKKMSRNDKSTEEKISYRNNIFSIWIDKNKFFQIQKLKWILFWYYQASVLLIPELMSEGKIHAIKYQETINKSLEIWRILGE